MEHGFSYRLGRALAEVPMSIYVLAALVASFWVAGWLLPEKSVQPSEKTAQRAATPSAEDRCKSERDAQLVAYRDNMSKGLPWQAATAIRSCSAILNDQELRDLVFAAELEDAVKTAKSDAQPLSHRVLAIERIETMAPARVSEFAKLKTQLEKSIEREEVRQRKAIAARKRSEGVTIGMSKDDVIASSWGRPESINKSIYSFGVHEQWVYGGRNYLYFEDGRLASIQTGN